jgi:HPr kinase/phosphorylase
MKEKIMNANASVSINDIINELALEAVFVPGDGADGLCSEISCPEVNRPGLPLAGYFNDFDKDRIQIIGNAEYNYLAKLDAKDRAERLEALFAHEPAAVVLTASLSIFPEMELFARNYAVPLLLSKDITSSFMAALIAYLNVCLAPQITRHGVLVEVYGEGILILGDSGVGKSETAIELVKRGHRLIADDAVEIKRVSKKTLVGSAPEIIRHYIELRGIGIIDVRRLFGMGSVKVTEKIDLVVTLEPWEQGKVYDRFGLDEKTETILEVEVPSILIPVRPGRNLAVIIEIAAMNNRQKKMGYNTAVEFNKRLMGESHDEQR